MRVALERLVELSRPPCCLLPLVLLFGPVTVTAEAVALVGDRAQLPAVGRGGVLDMAAQISDRTGSRPAA